MAQQHTYAMIKPGYEAFWGKVIDRITQEGLEIVNMKTMKFDDDFAAKFYAEHVGKPFYKDLAGYMTSGKIVALELAGPNAIAKWREIIGPTKKEVAVEQAPNSLNLFGQFLENLDQEEEVIDDLELPAETNTEKAQKINCEPLPMCWRAEENWEECEPLSALPFDESFSSLEEAAHYAKKFMCANWSW